jgi:hypothetical protein
MDGHGAFSKMPNRYTLPLSAADADMATWPSPANKVPEIK